MANEIDLTDYSAESSVSVSALFDRKKISRTKDYEGYLMVSIKAEDSDFQRPPVSIALCLDRSASMSGGKLDSVKETARKIVENMSDQDEVAIIVYDDAVDVVQERIKCTNKEALYARISGVQTGGCTNMSGGMLEAINHINETLDGVKRVMVLTDGLANRGVCDSKGLKKLVDNRDSTCTISTFGYGNGCNQELLADLAKSGGGNYYYISDQKDVKDVFARELGGILSCMAQNMQIKVTPNKDNEVLEVLNDYTVDDKKGAAVIRAEDIYVGETKRILIKMKVGKPAKAKDRPFSVARIVASFDDLKVGKKMTENINVKVEFVKKDDADKKPALEVAEQVAAIEAAKAQVEAVEMANSGNFVGAQSVLRSANAGLVAMADAGSDMAGDMAVAYSGEINNFAADNYTESMGQEIKTSSMGFMRSRSVGGYGMSANIGTRSQKKMLRAFKSKDPASVVLGPVKIKSESNAKIEDQIEKALKKTKKAKKKQFSKNRSRK